MISSKKFLVIAGIIIWHLISHSAFGQINDNLESTEADTIVVYEYEYDTIVLPVDTILNEIASPLITEFKKKDKAIRINYQHHMLSGKIKNASADVSSPLGSSLTASLSWKYNDFYYGIGLCFSYYIENKEKTLYGNWDTSVVKIYPDVYPEVQMVNVGRWTEQSWFLSFPLVVGISKEFGRIGVDFSAGPDLSFLLSQNFKSIEKDALDYNDHKSSSFLGFYPGIYLDLGFVFHVTPEYDIYMAASCKGRFFTEDELPVCFKQSVFSPSIGLVKRIGGEN